MNVLDRERAGEQMVVAERGRCATFHGQTLHFDGAWVLGTRGISRGRWTATYTVRKRKRWMAVGFALDSLKLNKPINRANIFVYASTGSIKANEHTQEAEASGDDAQGETNSAWLAFGTSYKSGDVICAHLDADEGTLAFSLNGTFETAKPAYVRLRGVTLWPAVYISGNLDAVEFECTRRTDSLESPNFLRFLETATADDLAFCDRVTFVVDGRRIDAHKFVLAARSDYFRAMLNNERLRRRHRTTGTAVQDERHRSSRASEEQDDLDALDVEEACEEEEEDVITIRGADYETFVAVLRFIYSGGEAEVPADSVVDVFKLAQEYTLRTLALRCVDHMFESVTAENALSIFSLCEAHLPLTERLKQRCVVVIRENVRAVAGSHSFAQLCADPELVRQLIARSRSVSTTTRFSKFEEYRWRLVSKGFGFTIRGRLSEFVPTETRALE